MRCRTCEYRLWNLTSRYCPECGTPYRPSDYQFVPNSVRFCCPHCSQEYYGTGTNGHLVPFAFNCVACHQPINMDEMVLLPADGYDEGQTEIEQLPWLVREKRGFARSWLSMIGLALFRPVRVMELAPLSGAVGSAWWFAIVTTTLASCLSMFPFFILPLAMGGRAGALGGIGGLAVVMMFGAVMIIAAWGVVTHLTLRVTGKVRGTIGRTYQGLCFSSGAHMISAVPCLGFYLGWIWWLVSAVIMVKEGQKVGSLRAAVAVLLFPMLLIGCGGTLVVLSLSRAMTAMSTMPASFQIDEASRLTEAIMTYAEAHDYHGPGHALVLVAAGLVDSDDFMTMSSATVVADIPVGAGDLNDFAQLSASEMMQAAVDAGATLPPGVIAHRVGDFVFTYHGATLNECPAGLWLVVQADDPDASASPAAAGNARFARISAGCADGSVRQFTRSALAAELAQQNSLRVQAGLPPLPDPFTVTHDMPAVAPPKP